MTTIPAVGSLVTAVAAFGLAGSPRLPAAPLDPAAWSGLLSDVGRERLEGLLGAAVAAGALVVTDEQMHDVRLVAQGRAAETLRLERELLLTHGALERAGIAHRVLKGHAWAHTVYPDPSWRAFGDVDLLVRTHDWDRTVEVLESTGATRSLPEVRPGFDRRFGKDATLLSASVREVDLHRLLVAGPYGLWVDEEELFSRSASMKVGGVDVAILDSEVGFLHACYNAALADDPPRLIALRDVAQAVISASFNAGDAQELARRWRASAVVTRAVTVASHTLGLALWEQPGPRPSRLAGFRPGIGRSSPPTGAPDGATPARPPPSLP